MPNDSSSTKLATKPIYFDDPTFQEILRNCNGDEEAALEELRWRKPKEVKRYEEIEKTRIYADPSLDPVIRALQKEITYKTNTDERVKKALSTSSPLYPQIWNSTNINYTLRLYDRFVSSYPEKAKAYANMTGGELIKRALEWEETRERKREEEKTSKSKSQSLSSSNSSISPPPPKTQNLSSSHLEETSKKETTPNLVAAAPISPLNLLSKREKTNLTLIFCQNWNQDWQEFSFTPPSALRPLVFNREEAKKLIQEQLQRSTAGLTPEQQTLLFTLGQDLDKQENRQKISQIVLSDYLKSKGLEINPKTQGLINRYQEHLKTLLENKPKREALPLPQLEKLEVAIGAQNQWQRLLVNQLNLAIAENLQTYYSGSLKQYRLNELSTQIENWIGRRLQEGKPLDENFTQQILWELKKNRCFQAAIRNPNQFQRSLNSIISQSNDQKNSLLSHYTTLRNFQMTTEPVYWQVSQWLMQEKNGLSVYETEKIINFLKLHVSKNASSWEIEHYLRTIFSRYPQLKEKAGTLASQTSLYLTTQLKDNQEGIKQTKKFAKKFQTQDFQAVRFYLIHGWSSSQLRELGFEDLAQRVEILEKNPQVQKEYQKRQNQKAKVWQKLDKITQRQLKKEAWRNYMATHQIGWLRTPKMRLKLALKKSQGWQKFKTFTSKLTPAFYINKTYISIGNFLARAGLDQASSAFLNAGFKGLAGNLLKKIGLGALRGPVGLVLSLLSLLSDKNFRELLTKALAALGYFLYYLFSHLPLTAIGAFLGSAVGTFFFGPLGGISGMFVGASIGYALDKSLIWLKTALADVGSFFSHLAISFSQTVVSFVNNLIITISQTATLAAVSFLSGITVIGSILATIITSIIAFFTITSAATLPPGVEIGGGIDAPLNSVPLPDISACQGQASCNWAITLASIIENCGDGKVDMENRLIVIECLDRIDNFYKQDIIDAINQSVLSYGKLQCVGFKRALEPKLKPYSQNAVAFLYNHPGEEISKEEVKVGDNAVWGPRQIMCPTSDPQEANNLCQQTSTEQPNYLYCCGHIGIVTKVDEDFIYITSAFGETGKVITAKFPRVADKNSGGPWLYFRP